MTLSHWTTGDKVCLNLLGWFASDTFLTEECQLVFPEQSSFRLFGIFDWQIQYVLEAFRGCLVFILVVTDETQDIAQAPRDIDWDVLVYGVRGYKGSGWKMSPRSPVIVNVCQSELWAMNCSQLQSCWLADAVVRDSKDGHCH